MVWLLKPAGCGSPLEPAPIGDFDPREQIVQAAATDCRDVRTGGAAVHLLEHLVEAMHRARRIGIPRHTRRQLERPRGQRIDVENPRVDAGGRQSRRARGQQPQVARQQPGIRIQRLQKRLERRAGGALRLWRTAGHGRRQGLVRAGLGRTDVVGAGIGGLLLNSLAEVRPRRSVLVHDALRQQVQNMLATLRLVRGVEMVEGPVLAIDDHHVLDRCRGVRIVRLERCRPRRNRGKRMGGDRRHRHAGQELLLADFHSRILCGFPVTAGNNIGRTDVVALRHVTDRELTFSCERHCLLAGGRLRPVAP